MQAKLLRVIQNREIQRVGSPETRTVDVRVIAATNRDLRAEVTSGRFREDLFYRLSSIEIRVPGLSERPEDIPILIQHFLKKYSQEYGKSFKGLTRRAQTAMLQHEWPGNVREIENVISSAAITATADFIDVTDLPEHLQRPRRNLASPSGEWRPLPLNEIRREHIQRVLDMCNGNRVRASQVLGIGRTSSTVFSNGRRNAPRQPPRKHQRRHALCKSPKKRFRAPANCSLVPALSFRLAYKKCCAAIQPEALAVNPFAPGIPSELAAPHPCPFSLQRMQIHR